ncbi:MAG: replication protein RepA [Candidatus Aenigmatarchaeota archaeon]|nr:replication protein RepA [Nanoarchaeota archaeon]
MAEDFKRSPAVARNISDIKIEDVRVRIVGTIIDKDESTIALDDGTGKIDVTFKEPVKEDVNTLVRVFGKAVPTDSGFELEGEIIQDMSGLDMDLYKQSISI